MLQDHRKGILTALFRVVTNQSGQFAFHPKKGLSFKQLQQQKVPSNLRIISEPIAEMMT